MDYTTGTSGKQPDEGIENTGRMEFWRTTGLGASTSLGPEDDRVLNRIDRGRNSGLIDSQPGERLIIRVIGHH